MKATRKTSRIVLAMAAVAALGCSGKNTETVRLEVPACSASYPTGSCDAGQSCFQGACVASASLCSPTNLTGTCASGLTCYGGGCVLPSVVPPTATAVDCTKAVYTEQPVLKFGTGTGKSKITVDGKDFRDLNGNGRLDPYEDWRLPEICRAQNLLTLMTASQKVGLMSEGANIGSGTDDASIPAAVSDLITKSNVRQALIRLSKPATTLAPYLNAVQTLCETQPLGIPFLITTDPSHQTVASTNAATGGVTLAESTILSPWPTPLGLGAAGDLALSAQYGDLVRREFKAMGFRWQLGPQIDLLTEPRWARVQSAIGDDGPAVANHAQAIIEGFQAKGSGGLKNGIAATMKHFPGAGADEDGMDSHTYKGRFNVFPGGMFLYHQLPFKAAISAGSAVVMPCYSIFKDQLTYDPMQVGSAFSKEMITDYLKKELGFDGMVTSDWGTMSTAAHGVEALSQPERVALFLKAGSHQLGNDSFTLVQAAYDQKLIGDADLDAAAGKILELSFKLGIFENPYTDTAVTASEVRSNANLTAGFDAMKKSVVLLKNQDHLNPQCYDYPVFCPPVAASAKYLPISGSRTYTATDGSTQYVDDTNGDGVVKVWYSGVDSSITATKDDTMMKVLTDRYDYASAAATGVLAVQPATSLADADLAVVRIVSRKGYYFGLDAGVPLSFDKPFPGQMADTGLAAAIKDRNKVIDLLRARDGYKKSDGTAVAPVNAKLKIIVIMHMDRPGIVKPFTDGLTTLDETAGVPGSYPLVSSTALTNPAGNTGIDGFLVEFGAYDRALLDVLFNRNVPAGWTYGKARLPMEIPSTDAEVEAQLEDVASDTHFPTYRTGAGMTY